MPKLRVFLVDDHPVVREGLKAIVGAHPEMQIVGEAADGVTACESIAATLPDVVVMDVSIPGLNGYQVTEQLNRRCSSVKVLALTVHEDNGHVHQLFNAGARGYLLKRTLGDGLICAILAVVAGERYLDPALASKFASKVGRPRRTDQAILVENELSEREAEVVRQTASGYGNKEIAQKLNLSVKTVETYRSRAMEKLGLQSRAELVQYVRLRNWE